MGPEESDLCKVSGIRHGFRVCFVVEIVLVPLSLFLNSKRVKCNAVQVPVELLQQMQAL